jgi:organic hydroperoxide reductase OsmC/OhrA
MSPRVAEHLDEQIGCAVDHLRVAVELVRRVHISNNANTAYDTIDVVCDRDAKVGEQIERGEPGSALSILDRELPPELSDVSTLAVPLTELPGEVQEIGGADELHVIRARAARPRQLEPELDEAIVDGHGTQSRVGMQNSYQDRAAQETGSFAPGAQVVIQLFGARAQPVAGDAPLPLSPSHEALMSTNARREHSYEIDVTWTGDRGSGTSAYQAYSRNHDIAASGKPVLPGSSDPAFRGDRTRYNPEELLVAALSACHMLAYLHLCADAGVVVTGYVDRARGVMTETEDGGGHFVEVVLRPEVTLNDERQRERAMTLHDDAHHCCFIASSVNFPVRCEPSTHTVREQVA